MKLKTEVVKRRRTECPFLDTINRAALDFDFEKVCSQSLTTINVYACLICGKFFEGRGKHTPAYTHSTTTGHHLFINLETCRIYCLPELYEVQDSSLDDIVQCLNPRTFSLDSRLARDVHGSAYLPGFVGLNNLRGNYINVIVHALAHVQPVRDALLRGEFTGVTGRFAQLVRKMWSAHNFKSVISPNEFVKEVPTMKQPCDFLAWLLNTLTIPLPFRGIVNGKPFLYLPLDIPPQPLFQKMTQISIFDVLAKFDGTKYQVEKLPPYLIFYFKRFSKNNFFYEKNSTIVNFPVRNLELKDLFGLDESHKYDLVANICHDLDDTSVDSDPLDSGTYRVHVKHETSGQWYEIQDLHVDETMPQLIGLSETLLTVYRRQPLEHPPL